MQDIKEWIMNYNMFIINLVITNYLHINVITKRYRIEPNMYVKYLDICI